MCINSQKLCFDLSEPDAISKNKKNEASKQSIGRRSEK